MMTFLPAYYYDHTLTGRLIPHSQSAGPQVECRQCRTVRFGVDFVRVGVKVVCVTCAPKEIHVS